MRRQKAHARVPQQSTTTMRGVQPAAAQKAGCAVANGI